MGELIELFETNVEIVTEKEEGLPKHALARLYYQFATGDQKNINGRIYPADLLSKRIEEKSKEIEESGILGQLDHPLDGRTKLQKAMHVLECLTYDKTDKKCYAESLVLNTQSGRDFMTILGAGAKLGASMRGWGNVHPTNRRVQNDWKLESIDFVLNPSFGKDATVDKTNLIESANALMIEKEILEEEEEELSEEEERKMNLVSEEEEKTLLGIAFESLKATGYKESWAEFYKTNKGLYRDKTLTEMADIVRSNIQKREAIQRVQPKDVIDEAVISGISPTKYAEIINRNLEEQVVIDETLSMDETQAVLRQARSAGIDTTDEKEKQRILNHARRQKVKNQKPLTEEQKDTLAEEKRKKDKQDDINSLVREKMIASKILS